MQGVANKLLNKIASTKTLTRPRNQQDLQIMKSERKVAPIRTRTEPTNEQEKIYRCKFLPQAHTSCIYRWKLAINSRMVQKT